MDLHPSGEAVSYPHGEEALQYRLEPCGPWSILRDTRTGRHQTPSSSSVVVMTESVDQRKLGWEAGKLASVRHAEGQINALAAQQIVLAVGERCHPMKEQPRRSTPHHDIAMLQPKAAACPSAPVRLTGRSRATPATPRRGAAEIALVPVLMQGHPRAGLVAIDQASIR